MTRITVIQGVDMEWVEQGLLGGGIIIVIIACVILFMDSK